MSPSKQLAHLNPLSQAIQRWFCQYLIGQRDLSPCTISAYRDTFKLLIHFLEKRYRKQATELSVVDLSPPRILAFLEDLELCRGNSARSRNARLAAIRSFIRYTASVEPMLLPVAQRLLAIPVKRCDRASVGHLSAEQMQLLLQAPDPSTRSGLRDQTLLLLMYNTGARVSEITALRVGDLHLDDGGSIHLHGKGRKHRAIPLWRSTVRLLRQWLKRIEQSPDHPLLPSARDTAMTRAGVAQRLRRAASIAAEHDPSLSKLRISPHTIRHTTAMHLLQSGVDLSVIALWLGHESMQTTHQYLEADLETKKRALEAMQTPKPPRSGKSAKTPILQFLEGL